MIPPHNSGALDKEIKPKMLRLPMMLEAWSLCYEGVPKCMQPGCSSTSLALHSPLRLVQKLMHSQHTTSRCSFLLLPVGQHDGTEHDLPQHGLCAAGGVEDPDLRCGGRCGRSGQQAERAGRMPVPVQGVLQLHS